MKKSNLQFILYILFAILPPFVSEEMIFQEMKAVSGSV